MYRKIENNIELKGILLHELIYFDKICRNNQIRYSIMFGTLLGAVRHKGFIPWDDDIDIFILRSDFEVLCKILESDKKYGILCVENNCKYNSIIPKFYNKNTRIVQNREGKKNNVIENSILGVYLDLFVLDDVPQKTLLRRIMLKYHDFLQLLWSFAYFAPNENHNRLINYIRKKINKTNVSIILARYIDKRARRKRATKYCGTLLYGGFNTRDTYVFEKGMFNSLINLSFEGKSVLALKNYDYWLRNEYGDYMTLPPKEKQVSIHDFDAYEVEETI